MVIPRKKPESSQRGPVLGGEASLAKLIESLKKPSPAKVKEGKKDTSAFQGKPFLKREEVRQWLRREKAWKITQIPAKDRPGLEKKLFDLKKFGIYIEPKEAERVYKELKNFPTKAKEKYEIKSESKRFKILNLLKEFLGK